MPYVQRDADGKVIGRFANKQPGYAEEFLADAHPDLAPSTADRLADFESDLDAFLDAQAQALTFKDRHSLALRAAYLNEWQALGAAFGTWMDACNALAWQGKQNILNGVRPMPATAAEFLSELPPFVPPSEA